VIAVESMLKDELNQDGARALLNLATISATQSERGREILIKFCSWLLQSAWKADSDLIGCY